MIQLLVGAVLGIVTLFLFRGFVKQLAVATAVSLVALHFSVLSTIAVIVAIGVVLLLRAVALVYFFYMSRRVLNGELGEESQWAAEIVADGDEKFIEAMNNTPRMRLQEFGIMAESKEELRDLVVEHYNQDIKSEINESYK